MWGFLDLSVWLKSMILWGWNQRKSTTSEALSLTAELQIPWDQRCPEISPILGAPEKVKENGISTNGILASRGWYGINEKGGKKDSVSANCSRSTKALALSSWLGKFRDNGGWQWISQYVCQLCFSWPTLTDEHQCSRQLAIARKDHAEFGPAMRFCHSYYG